MYKQKNVDFFNKVNKMAFFFNFVVRNNVMNLLQGNILDSVLHDSTINVVNDQRTLKKYFDDYICSVVPDGYVLAYYDNPLIFHGETSIRKLSNVEMNTPIPLFVNNMNLPADQNLLKFYVEIFF